MNKILPSIEQKKNENEKLFSKYNIPSKTMSDFIEKVVPTVPS